MAYKLIVKMSPCEMVLILPRILSPNFYLISKQILIVFQTFYSLYFHPVIEEPSLFQIIFQEENSHFIKVISRTKNRINQMYLGSTNIKSVFEYLYVFEKKNTTFVQNGYFCINFYFYQIRSVTQYVSSNILK